MTEPYTPPKASPDGGSEDDAVRRRRKLERRATWIPIACIGFPPLFGLVMWASSALFEAAAATPDTVADRMLIPLFTTTKGMLVGAIAGTLLLCVLIGFLKQRKAASARQADVPADQDSGK